MSPRMHCSISVVALQEMPYLYHCFFVFISKCVFVCICNCVFVCISNCVLFVFGFGCSCWIMSRARPPVIDEQQIVLTLCFARSADNVLALVKPDHCADVYIHSGADSHIYEDVDMTLVKM